MRSEDITPQTQFISSSQEEAVKNIENAKIFDINPDYYKQNRTDFEPEVARLSQPMYATPVVARTIASSPEHAAAVAPDANHLSWIEEKWNDFSESFARQGRRMVKDTETINKEIEKQVGHIGNVVAQKIGPQRELMDLGWKKLTSGGQLSEEDDFQLFVLREQSKNNFGMKDYGVKGPLETLPAEVIAQGVDMAMVVKRNAGLMASIIEGGAIWGGVAGTMLGTPFGGTQAGILAGAGFGLAASYPIAAAVDAYKSTAGDVYNYLDTAVTSDTPLNLDEKSKQYISHGVGIVSGALEFVTDKLTIKNTPWLKKLLDPTGLKALMSSQSPLKEAVVSIGKVAQINGTQEALQEIVQIIGEEVGNSYQDGELKFVSGLKRAADKIQHDPETRKRIGQVALVGATAGGTLAAVGPAVQVAAKYKTDIISTGSPIEQMHEILQFDDLVTASTEVLKQTKLQKLSPTETKNIIQKVVKLTKLPYVWINREDLDKQQKLREIIDSDGVAAATINAPVRVPMQEFLSLVVDNPELAEYARLHPEGPSRQQISVFVDEQEKAQAERAKVKEQLGIGKPISEETKKNIQETLDRKQPINNVQSEEDFLNLPTFTEPIEGVVSDKEINQINDAEREGRYAVIDSIEESVKWEMNKVIDEQEIIATEVEYEIQADKIASDPKFAIVDKFRSPSMEYQKTRHANLDELKAPHHKSGFSAFAIDPRTLTEEQKKKYLRDPQLKKHKVFVKGGVNAYESALLLGVRDADTLLDILSKTPTREEVVKARVEARKADIRRRSEESVDRPHLAIAEAYHRKTANHLAVMKHLLETNWTAVKKGIKRIALPLPRIEDLRRQAEEYVGKTKVGDLNPNQYKVGERVSQRNAMKAVLDHDLESAFINKQYAAQNSELTIATHIAVGDVNRIQRFLKRFQSKKTQQKIMDAGESYVKAAEAILSVFDFSKSSGSHTEEKAAFLKFAKEQQANGRTDMAIPERFWDARESINDMTVEDLRAVGNALKSILHQAEMKNKLLYEYGNPTKDMQTREALINEMEKVSEASPFHDPDRAINIQGWGSYTGKLIRWIRDPLLTMRNMEHLLLKVDGDKVAGLYNQTLTQRLKEAEFSKLQDSIELNAHMRKIIEAFGKSEFKKMENERIVVPEFEDSPQLSRGKITRGELFMMLLNSGNEGNSTRLSENFGVDMQVMREVFDRELTEKHAILAQQIMDTYESYFPRVKALHQEMAGVTPEFVEAVPFMHKGKVYKGGYYPIVTLEDMSVDRIRKSNDGIVKVVSGETKMNLSDTFHTDDMTRHGHTERRTANTEPLNLKMASIGYGFERILHDLNYRKPVHHALSLVIDKRVANSIASVVGTGGYNIIVNSIVDVAGSLHLENNALYDSTAVLEKLQARARSGLSAAYLVGNLGTMMIQPTSLVFAMERMGAKNSSKHMSLVLAKMAVNPHLLPDFYQFAEELNPSLKQFGAGIEEHARTPIAKLLPSRTLIPHTKGLTAIIETVDGAREGAVGAGFWTLGLIDQTMRTVVTVAAYHQFIAGDATLTYDELMALAPEERHRQASLYAQGIARLTLTTGSILDKSPLQKKYPMAAMFFNDGRNIINNVLRQGEKVASAAKKKKYGDMATAGMQMLVTLTVLRMMEDFVRGNPVPGTAETDNPEDLPEDLLHYAATSPLKVVARSIPVVRDINFNIENPFDNNLPQTVTNPQTTLLTDVLNLAKYGMEYMQYEGENIMSRKEAKSAGRILSVATGGVPVQLYFKMKDMLEEIDADDPAEFVPTQREEYAATVKQFKEDQEDLAPEDKTPQEVLDALDAIGEQIPGDEGAANDIPPGAIERIKQIESGGDVFAKNPNSSAAGLYQFTEDTWEDIMLRAPELGLTEAGRTLADTTQQEAAMKWWTEQNARILAQNDIPVTTESLYAAHFLGPEKAVEVLTAKGDEKLKNLVSDKVMTANGFKNSMKVKQFKSWVERKVSGVTVAMTEKE